MKRLPLIVLALALLGITDGGFDVLVANTATIATSATVGGNAVLTTATTSVGTANISDAAITLAKMANLAQDQFIVRTTASTGVPQTATVTSAARTVLDDTTVANMVNTLGGASSGGTGGIARLISPSFTTPSLGVATASSVISATLATTTSGFFYNPPSGPSCTQSGGGGVTDATPGTLALNPTSSARVIDNTDPDGCTVTMDDAAASAVSQGIFLVITMNNVSTGAGLFTFPDVAGEWDAPTLCSTTGISENGIVEARFMNAGGTSLWKVTACVD